MTHRALSVFFVFSAPLALAACISSHEPTVESLEVDATIASVTLADDCAAEAAPGLWAGDCAEDGPCGFCQQTSISLAIDASAEGTSVPFEVVSIHLFRMDDGGLVDELDPHAAQLFVDGAYTPWDERIAPGDSLNVIYDTSAPDWLAIHSDAFRAPGAEFRVEVVVRVDGVARTLSFSPVTREAEIVT